MPKGYAIHDTKDWTNFKVEDFDLKPAEDDDITLSITHCGVCGSDVHTISGGWGKLAVPYVIPGHEIIGTVTEVGKNVKDVKVGDRVGVGAQVSSCMNCVPCWNDNENYCRGDGKKGVLDTYNSKYADGSIAQGGYSTQIRAHQQFVFPIPDAISSENAASMLCAGITSYSPLLRNGCGPGKRVGIVGIGGLGHKLRFHSPQYGVLFAAAMGAEVIAISHSPSKREDALKMGAKEFISTKETPNWAKKLAQNPLDLIVSTASSSAVDLPAMLSTLNVHGKLVFVGMPEDSFKDMRVQAFAGNGCFFGSSHIGSRKEVLSMLKLAADKEIKPWIEVLPMSRCSEAVKRVSDNDVKYRFVLKQDLE
ncbi:GroES-like protein [Tilletiaria anomala UBC 951]|uniref:alcohol dehydrogenase (NADP(+)) n=1 Tax=Tilletiaria anomala (strain ATCC 24038 / CBS 436.72 / UBC 951) TaxID=1037660 RepID=A0A066WH79_TILAU|nr:GroES-like protein [Tilletiaria anomala UBC 951]KDN53332.1 GroES-like protein [Tilletiaria anomala UBC 951]